MLKRRRERDRPKAGPDALYDPNKRVLLSYASDDESPNNLNHELASEESPELAAHRVQYLDNTVAIAASSLDQKHPQDNGEAEDVASEEEEEEEERDEQPSTRSDNTPKTHSVRRNNTTGQMAALGSLSYQWEDEDEEGEYDSEAEDAMAYLRAVRSERQNMPTILRAASNDLGEMADDNGMDDTRGFFEDGAYVASASLGPHLPPTARGVVEPQEAFTLALKQRFLEHRKRMHMPITADPSPVPDGKSFLSISARHDHSSRGWDGLVRKLVPTPAQIRAIEQTDALHLLEFIRDNYFVRGVDIAHNVSVWLWSLLARLDDVGNMDNRQVSQIRELGKKAILIQLSFTDPAAAEQAAQNSAEGEIEANSAEPDTVDVGVSGMAEQDSMVITAVDDDVTRQNTLATLDTILVLVGDVFRQRDLLEFRPSWDQAVDAPQDSAAGTFP